MDVRQLKYFIAIVDAGSLSKASQTLYVAQPSLSQQIAGLDRAEDEAAVAKRPGRQADEGGQHRYRHTRLVLRLRQMDQIREDVREDRGSEAGAVAVGLPTTAILPASALAQHEPSTRPAMRRIVEPVISRPASVCWSHALPISAAALAVRKSIVELIGELHAEGLWTGITLRPPPDVATLADTGGSPGAQGFD